MNLVALKMLIGDRLKYLSIIAGVIFAALLITQQTSIFSGYAKRTGAWIRDSAVADLWVMDDQVEHTEDLKPLLDNMLNRVRGVQGVAWAVPMHKSYVNAILPDGTRRNLRVIGIDDATLTAGPPAMVQGHLSDLRQDKAVIMSADAPVTLDRSGGKPMRIGDRMSLNDNEAVVVGTYRSSPEFFWEPVIYTTYTRAKYLQKDQRRQLTYVLVKVKDGQDVQQVARRIEAISGLRALTSSEFEKATEQWILAKTGIYVNFGITIALGFIIGILAAGQTLYTFVLDNLRYFGALKAMGMGNLRIVKMVLLQVAVVTVIGFGVGIGIAAVTGRLMSGIGLAFNMSWQIVVLGFVGLLVCTSLAASLSLVRVLRLEPAIVFK